jgi:hypothetical protein
VHNVYEPELQPFRRYFCKEESHMELGMIGLGRMGASMVRRLLRAGHQCVVYDLDSEAVQALVKEGALGANSLENLASKLKAPRAVWMMVPATVVDPTLEILIPFLEADDVIIDGGKSHYQDDIRRATELKPKGIHYVDAGTSGGVWGSERGYCLMIGGDDAVVRRIDPIFSALAPNIDSAPRTPGQFSLPFAGDYAPLRPIILLLRSEFLAVVALRLPCRKRFGDCQHRVSKLIGVERQCRLFAFENRDVRASRVCCGR